jgi:hypothetical protein
MSIAKNSKPQFVPPIKTAASFLRTISKSPVPAVNPSTPTVAGLPLSHASRNLSLHTGLKQLTLPSSSRLTRDISHLQDAYKTRGIDLELPCSSIYILPTNIESLKRFVNISYDVESRSISKRSHVCFKNSCLEHFTTKSLSLSRWKIVDDCNKNSFELGTPTGSNEMVNLKEWFKHMKETFLNAIIKETKEEEKEYKIIDPEKFDVFDLILKAGLKECLRQLSVSNYERGELLLEIVQKMSLFWIAKFDYFEKFYLDKCKEDKLKIQELAKELSSKVAFYNEREKKVKII